MKCQLNEFSLYIHWPFCLKKCPYCDFNSYAMSHESLEWVQTIIKEINLYGNLFKNHKLKTIFFGGGTPSLIPPMYISLILNTIKNIWNYNEIEITLEVNPSSIETHNLEEFMQNGINRFSIGMQSLSDKNLNFLGRTHSVKEGIIITKEATKLCKNVSTDFIYTLPYDTLATWKKELNNIIEFLINLNIKHCSMYQLTIEPNTCFFNDIKNGKWTPMNDNLQSILYRYTHKTINKIGWNQYEISNISKNKASECQHNLNYWNYNQYLGVGPGAHSRMIINNEKHAFNNIKNPIEWKKLVNKQDSNFPFNFLEEIYILTKKEQFTEKLLMGLRLTEGVTIKQEEQQFINQEMLELLIKKNFIKNKNNKHSLSLNGKIKLNAILREIIL